MLHLFLPKRLIVTFRVYLFIFIFGGAPCWGEQEEARQEALRQAEARRLREEEEARLAAEATAAAAAAAAAEGGEVPPAEAPAEATA
jgi:hypothetical protein